MSGWISSKLKVAETFLQQIDQQAAESLGKNERPRSEELSNETPTRTGEIVPLKDQLKKKTSDNGDLYRHLRTDSDSNRPRDKELGSTLKTPSPSTPTLTDSDWTELLGAPKQPSPSAVNRSNGVSAIRGPQKDGRKPGNFGLNSLPSEIKKNQNSHSSVSRFTQRLDIESENRVNGGVASSNSKRSDEEEAGLSDSVLPKFSPYSPKDDGYAKGRETGANLLLELKVDKSQERKGVLDTNGNSKQSHSEIFSEKGTMGHAVMQPAAGNHMSEMEPVSGTIDGIADMKRQVDGDHDESRSALGRIDESNAALASSVTRDLHNSPKSDEGSDLDSDSASTSDSENEDEKRAERARRRERIMAEKAAAKAVEAIKERENIVARLEGEKQSLEKILEERARQQAQEASELQMSMMETMEAVDLEKQKHNNTRMEALSRLAKLETANAELARSLATTQWNLEIEANRVAALRQQIELKEMAHEDLRRKMSTVHQSGSYLNQLEASKGVEFEREILEAEYSFICDKIGQLKEKAMKLEENIEMTRKEIENPTEVEVELKRRLAQLTDHLIQKQAQVEALSSEKATLLFRIETVSRLLDENKLADSAGPSARNDLEAGMLEVSNSKLKSQFEVRIRSGGQHFRSLLWQLDALFSAGAAFLRRNSVAKLWSLVYLVCLHFWVVYILMSHSPPSDETKSGAIISLGSINKTAGV